MLGYGFDWQELYGHLHAVDESAYECWYDTHRSLSLSLTPSVDRLPSMITHISMAMQRNVDGSEQWYTLGQREGKKTERISGEICLRIEYIAGTVVEKKKASNLFTSAVKGVVSTAGDAAQFGIDGVTRGAKSTLGAAEGVAKGAVSTVGAGGKLMTEAATKGVKLTINTAEGVAKGAVSTAAGVGGIAVAGVGGIAGGVRSLAHSNSKKRITRIVRAGKKTKALLVPVKHYKGGAPGASWNEIKNFALTLRPHEKYVKHSCMCECVSQ